MFSAKNYCVLKLEMTAEGSQRGKPAGQRGSDVHGAPNMNQALN